MLPEHSAWQICWATCQSWVGIQLCPPLHAEHQYWWETQFLSLLLIVLGTRPRCKGWKMHSFKSPVSLELRTKLWLALSRTLALQGSIPVKQAEGMLRALPLPDFFQDSDNLLCSLCSCCVPFCRILHIASRWILWCVSLFSPLSPPSPARQLYLKKHYPLRDSGACP